MEQVYEVGDVDIREGEKWIKGNAQRLQTKQTNYIVLINITVTNK